MIPLKDSIPTNIFPFWTYAIIALNVYVFYLQLTVANPETFIAQYALIPNLVNFNDYITLFPFITSQFLHGGLMHIISNMWFLYIFGDNVEEGAGFLFFPIIYLLSGIAGGFAQYIFMPESSIPMLGASGAIAGVLGAYFAWFKNHTVKSLIPFFGLFTVLDIPAFIILFYWLITQVISGVGSIGGEDLGGVAYFAHIGGFLTGYLLAHLIPSKTSSNETF